MTANPSDELYPGTHLVTSAADRWEEPYVSDKMLARDAASPVPLLPLQPNGWPARFFRPTPGPRNHFRCGCSAAPWFAETTPIPIPVIPDYLQDDVRNRRCPACAHTRLVNKWRPSLEAIACGYYPHGFTGSPRKNDVLPALPKNVNDEHCLWAISAANPHATSQPRRPRLHGTFASATMRPNRVLRRYIASLGLHLVTQTVLKEHPDVDPATINPDGAVSGIIEKLGLRIEWGPFTPDQLVDHPHLDPQTPQGHENQSDLDSLVRWTTRLELTRLAGARDLRLTRAASRPPQARPSQGRPTSRLSDPDAHRQAVEVCLSKLPFSSYALARGWATAYAEQHGETDVQRPYRCEMCHEWHVSKQDELTNAASPTSTPALTGKEVAAARPPRPAGRNTPLTPAPATPTEANTPWARSLLNNLRGTNKKKGTS